ncbi:MAG: hypothetical protein AABX90_03205 [Nanoarchaeota archaeon]
MIPDEILNPIIEEIAGDDVVRLVQLVKGKSNVSEFKMAEKLDITVNNVRTMLYKLISYDLVESVRKKDKKKGWYVYFWTLNMPKVRDLAIRIKLNNIDKLSQRLRNEETTDFFRCPEKHIRASLTLAMEHDFKCPECGLNLEKDDNKKLIGAIKNNIEKLNEEVEFLKKLEIKPIQEKKERRAPKSKHKKPAKKKKIAKKPLKKKKSRKKKIKKKPQTKRKKR